MAEQLQRFWDSEHDCYQVHITAGDVYISDEPELIGTVLGSCIAVCAYDPGQKVGGMNHFMLPGHSSHEEHQEVRRYGSYAMELLINGLMKRGCNRKQLNFKLAGGADMLEGLSSVGCENISFIREFLQLEGFPVAAADLGGQQARKLLFNPVSGQMFIKRAGRIDRPVVQEERTLRRQLTDRIYKQQGDIELF